MTHMGDWGIKSVFGRLPNNVGKLVQIPLGKLKPFELRSLNFSVGGTFYKFCCKILLI